MLGMQTGTAALDISVAISQKIRKQSTSRAYNTAFEYILKKRSIIPQGHVHSSIVIVRTWKQPKCPPIEEWIRKIYTMEYYTAVKKIMMS